MLRQDELLVIKRNYAAFVLIKTTQDSENHIYLKIEPRDNDKDNLCFELKGEQELRKLHRMLGYIITQEYGEL